VYRFEREKNGGEWGERVRWVKDNMVMGPQQIEGGGRD